MHKKNTLRYIAFLLVTSIMGCASISADKNTSNQYDPEISMLFSTYMKNYNLHLQGLSDKADYSIYADVLSIGTKTGSKLWQKEEFIEGSKRFVLALKENDVAAIEWDTVQIKQLSDSGAVASVRSLRRNKNGEQIGAYGSATYLLAKSDSGWRILSFLVHEADMILSF